MPKLSVRIATDSGPRLCSTVHPTAQRAVALKLVTQRVKANGVPPHSARYPVCSDCAAKAKKLRPQAGITVTVVNL